MEDQEYKFSVTQQVLLTEEQAAFLDAEVLLRKQRGETSVFPSAHGGNRNVNKGMLLREGLELLREKSMKVAA